jgi:hypothetical protein
MTTNYVTRVHYLQWMSQQNLFIWF